VNRCGRGRAIASPEDIVIAPDGRHAYVAAYGSHAVAVFARDRSTGDLAQLEGRRGCTSHEGIGPCAAARALARPTAVAVSPDGRNVYVAATASSALAVFARNRRTGALRQLPGTKGCVSQRPGGGCLAGQALNEPVAVAVSPDGRRVYVAGRRFPSGVAILDRARDGSLSQAPGAAGCIAQSGHRGCAAGRGMRSPEDVAVSPDSRFVYVAGMKSNGVAVLHSDASGLGQLDGTAGCLARTAAEGCATGRGLVGAVELALSPDGRSVYAAASGGDALASLRRDRQTGELRQPSGTAGCLSQGGSGGRCRAGRVLDEVWGVAVSPDGRNVYAVSSRINAMAVISRTPRGALSPLPGRSSCFIRAGGFGCAEGRGLTVAVAVTVSPDGRNVYVASDDTVLGGIAIFRRRPA